MKKVLFYIMAGLSVYCFVGFAVFQWSQPRFHDIRRVDEVVVISLSLLFGILAYLFRDKPKVKHGLSLENRFKWEKARDKHLKKKRAA